MQETTGATRMQASIFKGITQLILIVFSVVLGIFVSERIEERKNRNEAMKLLSTIKAEVNDNKALVEYWAPYHKEIAIRLDSLSKSDVFVEEFIDDKSSLFRQILTRGTFMDRMPASDAWDIAKGHPLIVNFDYDELLILSKIYNQQESTFEPTGNISETFLSPDFNSREGAKSNLQNITNQMQEIVGRQISLLTYYREAEEILDLQSTEE